MSLAVAALRATHAAAGTAGGRVFSKAAAGVVQDFAARQATSSIRQLRARMPKLTPAIKTNTSQAPKTQTMPKFTSPAASTMSKAKAIKTAADARGLGVMTALIKAASIASVTAPGGGGAGPQPCLEGWGTAIGRRVAARVEALKKKLKPGDIINTDPRNPRGPDRVFKAVSKAVQGTRFGHSAMYDGKGHVIEARGHTVVRRPLLDLARCNQLVAVAPHGVSDAERNRAVAWMRKHIGNDALKVTVGNLAVHGARPTILSKGHEGERQEIERALCSSLIANAYATTPFNKDRRIADTRPVDLLHSDQVKVVGKVT